MPPNAATRPGPIRLALVDDDEFVRFPLVAMLEDSGIQVCECAGGAEALVALSDPYTVDVVLTDVNMPGMDGVRLAEILWARRPELPVIFMSGQVRPDCARLFLPKPFSLKNLLGSLHMALSGGLIAPA